MQITGAKCTKGQNALAELLFCLLNLLSGVWLSCGRRRCGLLIKLHVAPTETHLGDTQLLLRVSKQCATFSGSNIYRVNHSDQLAGCRSANYISHCLIDVPRSIDMIYSTVKRLSGLRVLSTGRQEVLFDRKKKPEWRRYVLLRKQVW